MEIDTDDRAWRVGIYNQGRNPQYQQAFKVDKVKGQTKNQDIPFTEETFQKTELN